MTPATSAGAALDLLERGDIEVVGLLPHSSNYTFFVRVTDGGSVIPAVYKPSRGERPLWDFPPGTLAARERAAFIVAEVVGWSIVPSTVLRREVPLGEGSLQQFIRHDPDRHYFALMEERREEFARFAAFDVVINNADRKAGHVLEDPEGRLWAVDHGLSFHVEPKLRTVIWSFAEQPLGDDVRRGLERLGAELAAPDGVSRELAALLSEPEAAAALERVEALLVEDAFPAPGGDRPLPWPLI